MGAQINAAELCISPASFRDPAGYVFFEGDIAKRAVTFKGQPDYEIFISSGLYKALLERELILAHQEDARRVEPASGIYKVIVPEQLDYISYPYEWSFSQFKDAALLTLEVQQLAMEHGLSLKDASAFNLQFRGPKPVFIDTLSFEKNKRGPWVAYGQFCQHFLAPLLLMAYVSANFNQFLKAALEGFSLQLTSALLPRSTYLRLGPLLHVHLHARSQKKHSTRPKLAPSPGGSSSGSDTKPTLVSSLRSTIENLKGGKQSQSHWIDYYRQARHYPQEAEEFKKKVVSSTVRAIRPARVFDLGGNVGHYSRLVTAQGINCICYDFDPSCVDQNYLLSKASRDAHMLPLLMDLTNPTPGLGFDCRERLGFAERSKPDLILALAILHHLRVAGNIPLARISEFLAKLTRWLLIEFVPKEDRCVQVLLLGRPDIFDDYSLPEFLRIFQRQFQLEQALQIPCTMRWLCLLRKRL